MATVSKAAGLILELTPELESFCTRLGITKYVPIAIRLIEDSFPTASQLTCYDEIDPESGEEWLVLDVFVSGDVPEIYEQYKRYTRGKVQQIPRPEADRIRLSHHYNE